MIRLESKFVTVITETVWNYEYETVDEFEVHKVEMQAKGILPHLTHVRKDGKCIATYIKNEHQEDKVIL